MILRRISQAVARQHWSTLFIELVILVVGVFVGLQVDDWNQARKDRVDEHEYLERLHADMMLAGELTSRLRNRMIERRELIKSAGDVLFGHVERNTLSSEECAALAASNIFTSIAPQIAAFDELVSTGRLGIIRDAELLSALIGLEQSRVALATMVSIQTSQNSYAYLPVSHPELIAATAYGAPDSGEIRISAECDLGAMGADRSFRNQFTVNADGFDAFIRDGLSPWSLQFSRVHALLDASLGYEHE